MKTLIQEKNSTVYCTFLASLHHFLKSQIKRLFMLEAGQDGTLNGISPCMYCIYLLFVPLRLYGKNFARSTFLKCRIYFYNFNMIHFNCAKSL